MQTKYDNVVGSILQIEALSLVTSFAIFIWEYALYAAYFVYLIKF